MKTKISLLVMGMVMIKKILVQKKFLNHLKNDLINKLILANLMKIIISLWIMLQNLKNINPEKER